MANLKSAQQQNGENNDHNQAVAEAQLKDIQTLLARKKDECDQQKQDLNKKIHDTTQFRELKAMMTKKNVQIKELRTKLAKYEPDSNGVEEESP